MSDHKHPESVEIQLNPNLTLRRDLDWARLGLVAARKEAQDATRRMLLANLCLAQMHGPGVAVYYSRDAAHYARVRQSAPSTYTLRNMRAVVQELEQTGLVRHIRTRPSAHATRRSTVVLVPAHAEYGVASMSDLRFSMPNPVILKNAHGQHVPYRDSKSLRSIRTDVLEQNEMLRGLKITLEGPVWERDHVGLYRVGGKVDPVRLVNPMFTDLYRVFNNGDWAQGGRWYGGWWQQLPRSSRAHLLIDGRPVCEEDYTACHLRLMCAIARVPVPKNDPYRISAIDEAMQDPAAARRLTKIAFQILVNAETSAAAHKAIGGEISDGDEITAGVVVKAIKAQFKAFAPLWHTGLGLRLQRLDSDIAADVMRQLRTQSIPVLSVHDSFIVPVGNRQELLAAMDRAFQDGLLRAARLPTVIH